VTTGEATSRQFIFRRNWFVLSQTEGQPYTPPPLPDWNRTRALAALDVTEVPFDLMDDNCQGYAKARSIAVSPIAAMAEKTTFPRTRPCGTRSHGHHRTDRRRPDTPLHPRSAGRGRGPTLLRCAESAEL
jgi:hypothetical protein